MMILYRELLNTIKPSQCNRIVDDEIYYNFDNKIDLKK